MMAALHVSVFQWLNSKKKLIGTPKPSHNLSFFIQNLASNAREKEAVAAAVEILNLINMEKIPFTYNEYLFEKIN